MQITVKHTQTHTPFTNTRIFLWRVKMSSTHAGQQQTTEPPPPTHFLCPCPQSDSGNENNIRLLEHWPSNTVDCRLWHRRRDKAESGHDYGERYLFLNEIRFFCLTSCRIYVLDSILYKRKHFE